MKWACSMYIVRWLKSLATKQSHFYLTNSIYLQTFCTKTCILKVLRKLEMLPHMPVVFVMYINVGFMDIKQYAKVYCCFVSTSRGTNITDCGIVSSN